MQSIHAISKVSLPRCAADRDERWNALRRELESDSILAYLSLSILRKSQLRYDLVRTQVRLKCLHFAFTFTDETVGDAAVCVCLFLSHKIFASCLQSSIACDFPRRVALSLLKTSQSHHVFLESGLVLRNKKLQNLKFSAYSMRISRSDLY